MKDQKNKKKLKDIATTVKDLVVEYKKDASDRVKEGRENIKKVANLAIEKTEMITKSAKKEVKSL